MRKFQIAFSLLFSMVWAFDNYIQAGNKLGIGFEILTNQIQVIYSESDNQLSILGS